MKESLFKRLIILKSIFLILGLLKISIYPYLLAPEALRKAIFTWEETQVLSNSFFVLLGIFLIIFIGKFYSLFLLFKFRKLGRQIYLVIIILSILFVFSDGYIFFDHIGYLIQAINLLLSGVIISVSYYSEIAKEFK